MPPVSFCKFHIATSAGSEIRSVCEPASYCVLPAAAFHATTRALSDRALKVPVSLITSLAPLIPLPYANITPLSFKFSVAPAANDIASPVLARAKPPLILTIELVAVAETARP